MNIRKNDTVLVITGKYKGRRGRVLRVFPKESRLLVEGVNMIKRHTRPTNRQQQGGIVEREGPIHMSNVMPWCEAAGAPSKIVMKRLEDGTRVRVYKINGETLND
ncbi:MAG TPA: 50S ribosomal protein L24 [Candidatus Hydrogenedentes bacterium]|nr:50S ribosomal protein L24 [Candidatus Hydrogenedentota bacterium]HOV74516.1 50S ribosomal protein L24 [Candidatus Hydrogenedentota bacterium]HPC18046.1 50S ribosomal protein L24 [Candidatus Hydrogenedentota bacterium]HRT21936.1 50S ribosomal protein L24 [Candidatus Hydrogenedentota bacterium]HRT66497.1 50S ribosomal protein L24 [Candidatus Hydrogenedentota bacterium]